jgi:tetratricopeptide (TPR) repeat protein
MARALRGLGFAVMERHDLTREQMFKALADFRAALSGREIGVFYFAGHGLAIEGENYLVPVRSGFTAVQADAVALRLQAEARLINAEQIIADMNSAGAGCNVVILDACRNAPGMVSRGTRSVVARGGLAEMTPPAGTLIAFATDSGRVAYDGDEDNGLYTEELVRHLQTPGLTLEQVFKRTRAGVLKRSNGGQLPAEYSRLVGDDVFLAGPVPNGAAPVAEPSPRVGVLDRLSEQPPETAEALIVETLDSAKEALKSAAGPSSRIVQVEADCAQLAEDLPTILPSDHPRLAELTAKAHNRRGDALLVLGRPREALNAFEQAHAADPDDLYVLFNRGRAQRTLGDIAAARQDFQAVITSNAESPGAKKLAREALARLDAR